MSGLSQTNFTEGPVFGPLVRFAFPVLMALLLQSAYGAVDLLVVGRFATTADIAGVANGSALMQVITFLLNSFATGITVLTAQGIGSDDQKLAKQAVGTGLVLFFFLSILITVPLLIWTELYARLLHTPPEAMAQTCTYVRICGAGTLFIAAYNTVGSIFRGIGDSMMPLITVSIACALNIAGDLIGVAVFHLGTAGAAIATVVSQAASVLLSLLIIRRRHLPFRMGLSDLRLHRTTASRLIRLGTPLSLENLLVSSSFMVIQAIINSMGLIASAGTGTADKVCGFIMLVPIAFSQAMSAFVAQNIGAARPSRAHKALIYGISASFVVGIFMAWLTFFHGDCLATVFSSDNAVVAAAFSYLKAYAIDCLLTCFLFCFLGYYNGCGNTTFVMLQGLFSAFCVRIPVALAMSHTTGVTLFRIALATPITSVVQIALCLIVFFGQRKKTDDLSFH